MSLTLEQQEEIMQRMSSDNPRSRSHREDHGDGWSAWRCVPVADVVVARSALLDLDRQQEAAQLLQEAIDHEWITGPSTRTTFADDPWNAWVQRAHSWGLSAQAVPVPEVPPDDPRHPWKQAARDGRWEEAERLLAEAEGRL